MALLQDAAEALAEPRGVLDMPNGDGYPTSSSTPVQAAVAEEAAALSVGGAAPAAERLQKRVALPQHAMLATQLQVCPRASSSGPKNPKKAEARA